MKKTWIITLAVLGVVLMLQQSVLSSTTTETPAPNLSNIVNSEDEVIITMSSFDQNENANATGSSGISHISPTVPPTPTTTHPTGASLFTINTPTPSPVIPNSPITPTNSIANGGGGSAINTNPSLSSQLQNWFQNMLGSNTPTPTQKPLIPSNTPIPTSPSTQKPLTPSNTPIPTTTSVQKPLVPTNTPIPTPTSSSGTSNSFLPDSLVTEKEKKGNITTAILDTTILTEIIIVPNAFAAENTPTEKPLLPQEKEIATADKSPITGGIMVSLEQKMGNTFVTHQDELTVKRGNQFFTISNQNNELETQKEQNIPSNTPPKSSPQLAINANNVIAQSSMGLSVDPLSGILTVQTPSGPQRVSIMPDEALGIVTELKALNTGSTKEPSILLVSEKGSLIYRISGEKVEKFLGLFPLSVQKQVLISADTGSVVDVELSSFSQFLSIFTF